MQEVTVCNFTIEQQNLAECKDRVYQSEFKRGEIEMKQLNFCSSVLCVCSVCSMKGI